MQGDQNEQSHKQQNQQPKSQNNQTQKKQSQQTSQKQDISVSNTKELEGELMEMGFQSYLIKEAIAVTKDKDQAIKYIINALDENDNGEKMMKMEAQELEEDYEDVQEQYKMVFLVRMDLKMGLGKIAAQVGHATLRAYKQMQKSSDHNELHEVAFFQWLQTGQKKIVVKVNDQPELLAIVHKAQMSKINNCYIRDAGLTQIEAGSITVAALGPASDSELKKITGHLKLL